MGLRRLGGDGAGVATEVEVVVHGGYFMRVLGLGWVDMGGTSIEVYTPSAPLEHQTTIRIREIHPVYPALRKRLTRAVAQRNGVKRVACTRGWAAL